MHKYLLILIMLTGCAQPISFYAGDWDSIRLINHIAAYIIENGYGNKVILHEINESAYTQAFNDGEFQVDMEVWLPNVEQWYNQQLQQGSITPLGNIFESGPQFWVIPQWIADQYNIRSVTDMQQHWDLFKNPQNPSKGLFYNCVLGWECGPINEAKMKSYGLDRFFDSISTGTSEALNMAFIRAQENKTPIFGYLWSPSPIMGRYQWQILAEPPFDPTTWRMLLEDIANHNPPQKACAYESAPVEKIVHTDLTKREPAIVEMLGRMNVGLTPLNESLAWSHDKNDWQAAAIYYLKNNESRWKTWVTPKAYKRIKRSLALEQT